MPQLSSTSDLRAGFLQASPELQQRLMQEAELLPQQQNYQQQQQQQLQQQHGGQLGSGSPQSSPSIGGFGPRLAHATTRLSDFDLSSHANSTTSRFSIAETATSIGSGPPRGGMAAAAQVHPAAPPPRLATTIGFSNPMGVWSAGQLSNANQAASAQTWQPHSVQAAADVRHVPGGASPDLLQQQQQPRDSMPAADAQAASMRYGSSMSAGTSPPQHQQQGAVQHAMQQSTSLPASEPEQQPQAPYVQWQNPQLLAPDQQQQWQQCQQLQQQHHQQQTALPSAAPDSALPQWAAFPTGELLKALSTSPCQCF